MRFSATLPLILLSLIPTTSSFPLAPSLIHKDGAPQWPTVDGSAVIWSDRGFRHPGTHVWAKTSGNPAPVSQLTQESVLDRACSGFLDRQQKEFPSGFKHLVSVELRTPMSLRSLSVILRVKEESVVTMEGCKKELRDIFTLSGRQLTTGETGVLYTRGGWSCVEKGRVKWEAKMWGWESVKDAFGECDDAE